MACLSLHVEEEVAVTAGAGDFGRPMHVVAFSTDLRARCLMRRRMRIGTRGFGLPGKTLLIAMATGADICRRRVARRTLLMALRTTHSVSAMSGNKQSLIRVSRMAAYGYHH